MEHGDEPPVPYALMPLVNAVLTKSDAPPVVPTPEEREARAKAEEDTTARYNRDAPALRHPAARTFYLHFCTPARQNPMLTVILLKLALLAALAFTVPYYVCEGGSHGRAPTKLMTRNHSGENEPLMPSLPPNATNSNNGDF